MRTLNGLLVVDKPQGITSRDAVDRVQRWFPRRTKVGHAGTLDPLATGVLVIAVGPCTRLIEYVQDMAKCYTSRFLLGATSDTDDLDGTVTAHPGGVIPTPNQVEEALASFVGEIEQTPPAYSAAKVAGKRAYALARGGEEVKLAPRQVRVDSIEIRSYEYPQLEVTIECGKGTYVRSIARDLGRLLDCGGLVGTLRRERIGPFLAEEAHSLDGDPEDAAELLRPASEAVAALPKVGFGQEEVRRFRNGQPVRSPGVGGEEGAHVAVMDEAGELVGVATADPTGQLRSLKVIPGAT